MQSENGTMGPGSNFGFDTDADFEDLAGAVVTLAAHEQGDRVESFCATNAWSSDDSAGHIGGGVLANQF